MSKIILFGGTTEGRKLAEYCARHKIDTLVCVVSGYGAHVLPESPWIKIRQEALQEEEMAALIRLEKPALVLDATHPYAAAATENIRKACCANGIPYVRVSREETGKQGQTASPAVTVSSAAEAVEYLKGTAGAILLTTGSKELPAFCSLEDFENRIYARILPDSRNLAMCEDMGLKRGHIIAMQGPFSTEMNLALIHATKAAFLVTKESGTAGGFLEKLEAADAANITTIIIGRPQKPEGISLREAVRLLEPFGQAYPQKISLVGIGMGSSGLMTADAACRIREAEGVAGARRMLDAVSGMTAGKLLLDAYKPQEILSWILEHPEMERICLIYSGDTGFHSGAASMTELFSHCREPFDVEVLPGISTVSYLCARLKTSWDDVYLGSLHGCEMNLENLLESHKRVFLLLGGSSPVAELCRRLTDSGYGNAKIWAGQHLSYEDEHIFTGTAAELVNTASDSLCAVLIERE